ncbi:hypothetical protein [Streptomyces sp. SP17KL33]|uniref:hypothetical protein n=1 Tax=Streptomyces sp. SP17KL33 TaxID=3002534 RepID=UPI002E78A2D5|nr:hypothetical protein [Streptomyces sp. SP17KL33]MEE1838195.1 hypothetical protein [Streptomyces sp. SP17KL33]
MPSMPPGYKPLASRSARRRVSRKTARQQTAAMHNFLGTAPRYEAARDTTCERHHRKRPCARCE